MYSEFFYFPKGSILFPCCVPHLAPVNGFNLLATAEVTKEINFSEGYLCGQSMVRLDRHHVYSHLFSAYDILKNFIVLFL